MNKDVYFLAGWITGGPVAMVFTEIDSHLGRTALVFFSYLFCISALKFIDRKFFGEK